MDTSLVKLFNKAVTVSTISEYCRNNFANLVKFLHPTSSPYLSGDTFRSFCHVRIDENATRSEIREQVKRLTTLTNEKAIRLFVDLHVVQSEDTEADLIGSLTRLPLETRQKTFVLFHNHDKIPDQNFFKQLTMLGCSPFSVNAVGISDFVRPLPIGLENRWRLNNGRVGPFKRLQSKVQSRAARENLVFAAFNVHTNASEREVARLACMSEGIPVIEDRSSPRKHRKHLLNSYFVISPPGNGLDCHRTWEAIYLGCVPVVLCDSLSEEFTTRLPIFAVKDWSDFFKLSTDQKLAAYERLRKRSSDLAFDTAWKRRLEVLTTV
jgi:hypothetical protein